VCPSKPDGVDPSSLGPSMAEWGRTPFFYAVQSPPWMERTLTTLRFFSPSRPVALPTFPALFLGPLGSVCRWSVRRQQDDNLPTFNEFTSVTQVRLLLCLLFFLKNTPRTVLQFRTTGQINPWKRKNTFVPFPDSCISFPSLLFPPPILLTILLSVQETSPFFPFRLPFPPLSWPI